MNNRADVLAYLIGTDSMIKLTTGAVINGMVNKDVIVVHDACPRVVREIVTKFGHVSVTEQGMMIPVS